MEADGWAGMGRERGGIWKSNPNTIIPARTKEKVYLCMFRSHESISKACKLYKIKEMSRESGQLTLKCERCDCNNCNTRHNPANKKSYVSSKELAMYYVTWERDTPSFSFQLSVYLTYMTQTGYKNMHTLYRPRKVNAL